MRLNFSIFLALLISLSAIDAQESAIYTSHLKDYQKAITLYNNNQYKAAQSLFQSIGDGSSDRQVKSECAYYVANCAVRLNQRNADDLIEGFVETYPTSTKRNMAFMDVANYYFQNSQYAYAKKWFDKVDELSIDRGEVDKFYFEYGYSLYKTGDERQANKYLKRVSDSKVYGSQAKYYLGYMAYEGDDYESASDYFDQVSGDRKYQQKLAYYQADLNFKLGKFQEAIDLALPQLNTRDKRQLSELNKIIGESYFNLEKYEESIPYLQSYEGKKGQWNNTDFYQLGYAYYKQKDYESAVNEFNKIIDGRNAVAQNAYYHLGESYINLDKKSEALNAFRNAAQMDFDLKIKEDAWLNYAKLSYDIGNPYQSVPQVLTLYLDQYPDSSFYSEIEVLLIDSYISSKNYEEALVLLKGKSGFENKLAYQKAAFYRGLELYNELNFSVARDFFKKSLSEPRDPVINVRATFWLAETDYNLSDFNEALIGFKQFSGMSSSPSTEEFRGLNYHIAYTYFKLKDYENATMYFQKYLEQNDDNQMRRGDAFLRLGDGYFVTSNYSKAIDAYNESTSFRDVESDYAAFQSAMSYGYMGDIETKTRSLEQFANRYKNSALRDDAFYELGNTYVKSNEIPQALSNYEKLIDQYPNSVFVPKALLRQGLVFYNSSQNDKALSQFKSVAENYPQSEEAVQAVATARLIYIDIGQVDDYARWVRRLDFVEVTDAELDNTSYLAAEKQYIDGNTDKAIKQFNSYLNSFPEGIHALKSHFYLAQMYYQKDLPDNALEHFEYVVNAPKNEYSEQSTVRLGEILLNNKNWDAALPVLENLEKNADYPQNIQFARSNLMKVYYQMENFSLSKTYASQLMNSTKDEQIKRDAQIILARSSMQLGDEDTAADVYKALAKSSSGSIAAESLYFKAYFENKSNDHEASNRTLQGLIKDYSSYKEFSAKGLVVMAKNYAALNDAFQATYILESVLENFQDFPEVTDQAKQELALIKSEQSKTNSSIETGEN